MPDNDEIERYAQSERAKTWECPTCGRRYPLWVVFCDKCADRMLGGRAPEQKDDDDV
jgi:hypothetical protein